MWKKCLGYNGEGLGNEGSEDHSFLMLEIQMLIQLTSQRHVCRGASYPPMSLWELAHRRMSTPMEALVRRGEWCWRWRWFTAQSLRRVRTWFYHLTGWIGFGVRMSRKQILTVLSPFLPTRSCHSLSPESIWAGSGKGWRGMTVPSSTSHGDLSHPWEPNEVQGPRAQGRMLGTRSAIKTVRNCPWFLVSSQQMWCPFAHPEVLSTTREQVLIMVHHFISEGYWYLF